MDINISKTVRELVLDLPQASQIFETLGIDYCCGGEKTLKEACGEANVKLTEVVAWLEKLDMDFLPQTGWVDWRNSSINELISHILNTHHTFTKEALERLSRLMSKVVTVHVERHTELLKLQSLFQELQQDLIAHMMKEERVLFPYAIRLENNVESQKITPLPPFGTVRNPIYVMTQEHEKAGEILREIRSLTDNFQPPADACTSYQMLYQELKAFEQDLHQHIHLENNILFPRALDYERKAWLVNPI